MNLTTTLLFYLLLGSAVAVAVYLTFSDTSRGQRWFRTLTAVVFWPLYLPVLLQRPECHVAQAIENGESNGLSRKDVVNADEMSAAIHQVETELDLALTSLGGWSDAVLAREQHRFEELRVAWHAQAAKIRELDQVLSKLVVAETAASPPATVASERVASSLRARQTNIIRLRALRDRYHADLMNTLAWVRELVTMIHLAKYTGAPASRAEELVMQIATSIEGLTEVAAWRDADSPERHPSSIRMAEPVS
jgi:hypothetical protein